MINFRSVNSQEAYAALVAFLIEDVMQHGGSAGETINMHGQLWDVTVCRVPWGTLILTQETTKLEAMNKFFNSDHSTEHQDEHL